MCLCLGRAVSHAHHLRPVVEEGPDPVTDSVMWSITVELLEIIVVNAEDKNRLLM